MPVERSGGFSLIETMITLFVLSIGLLSLQALQLMTLEAARMAQYRAVTSRHAHQFAAGLRSAAALSAQDHAEASARLQQQLARALPRASQLHVGLCRQQGLEAPADTAPTPCAEHGALTLEIIWSLARGTHRYRLPILP